MKVNLLGVKFDQVSLPQAVEKIEALIKKGGFHQVGTMNPEYVVKAQENQQLKKAIAKMDLIVPDGVGIIWASKLKGKRGLTRIRGGDLVANLANLCQKKGYKIALVGAERGVAQKALLVLKKRYPRLSGFALSEPDIKIIKKEKPKVLLTALSFKGPVWLESLRKENLSLVCLEVGGVFNYLAGKSKLPPKLIQQIGLEWFWRLINEPWRFKRQLKLIKFLWLVFKTS